MKCGLLGRKLGHSYSPQIHSHLGDYSYLLYEKEPEELEVFLKQGDFSGINVTIPYKKDVIPYLDELSPTAQKLGAVNTIVRRPDGTLLGHNTDYFGFASMVSRSGLSVSGKKVLVLGSGGASQTAAAVLEEFGARVVVISRTGKDNYSNLHLHADAAFLVNATPVGMYSSDGILQQNSFPHVESCPVSLSLFPRLEGVWDLVYNPARTKLLRGAESQGIPFENGLWMLVAQAKEAAEYFTGSPLPDTVIPSIHKKLSLQMQNLILIGMPGCGKTTIGKALAKRTKRQFLDSDGFVSFLAEKSVAEIILQDGLAAFRARETDVLRTLASQSGRILSTGGGCVTRDENYPLLHQNGIIIWLQRDTARLVTDGRPLSQSGTLDEMSAVRKPMYARFADHIVDNNGSPEDTVSQILALLEESP